MEPEKFMDLVEKMRYAQRDYFRTKQYDRLVVSRALEKQVDQVIKNRNQNQIEF